MNTSDTFFVKLYQLADALDALSREFSDLYQQYDGNVFEEQHPLATDTFDNMLLAATHEAASVIRFTGNDLQLLARYIDFRKQFPRLTDKELAAIIDDASLSMAVKRDLTTRLANGDASLMLENLRTIRVSWNQAFANVSYQRIRTKFLGKE
jgi:hypothetical protein